MPNELKNDPLKLMVDIETLGLDHNAAIVQISAAPFTFEAGVQEDNVFDAKIDIACYKKPAYKNFDIDMNTLKWWMKQSNSATVFDGKKELDTAIAEFADYVKTFPESTTIWCQGLSFDIPKLSFACKEFGVTVPWKFWNERCSRAFLAMAPDIGPSRRASHDALQDVKDQIQNCCVAWSLLNKN